MGAALGPFDTHAAISATNKPSCGCEQILASWKTPRRCPDEGGVRELEQGTIYTLMEFSKHGQQRPCAESNERIDICKESKEIVKHDIIHLHPLPYLQPGGGSFGWEKDTFIDELARPGLRKSIEEDRAPATYDKIVDHDASMLHALPQQTTTTTPPF